MNNNEKKYIYIAGFIDGDGMISAQIVHRKDYKYKFGVRISIVLFQKTSRYWFLQQIQQELGLGTLRKRIDGMSELAIVGNTPALTLIPKLLPYLRIKKPVAKLILNIIKMQSEVKTIGDFLEVCKLVDEVANFTDNKTRKINSKFVSDYLHITPVETS